MGSVQLENQDQPAQWNHGVELAGLLHLQRASLPELTLDRITELFTRSRISTSPTEISNGSMRDMLIIIGFLHRGEKSGNIKGTRNLSYRISRAIDHESFAELPQPVQEFLNRWHCLTGAQRPTVSVVPIRSIIAEEAELIEDSEIDLSGWTEQDLEENLTSKKMVPIGCGGCGEVQSSSIASFRQSISYAKRNRTLLRCKGCGVSTGRIEDATVAFCEGMIAGMDLPDGEGPIFVTQYQIPGISDRMRGDGAFIFPDGFVHVVEVDGGFHWKNRDPAALLKKIAADELKTATVLEAGHAMLRIDERNLTQLTAEIKEELKRAARRRAEKYNVMGEECPGAARVSDELKGWS